MENAFFCPLFDSAEILNLIHRQMNKATDHMNTPLFIYKIYPP